MEGRGGWWASPCPHAASASSPWRFHVGTAGAEGPVLQVLLQRREQPQLVTSWWKWKRDISSFFSKSPGNDMEPLGSIGSIPPKAAGSSLTASQGKTLCSYQQNSQETCKEEQWLQFGSSHRTAQGAGVWTGSVPMEILNISTGAWIRAPLGTGTMADGHWPQTGCPSGSSWGLICSAAVEFGFPPT